MRTISRFLIVLALLPALLAPALAADSRYPEKEHLPVDYADMDASGFDETKLQAALTALEDLCASPQGQREDPQARTRVQSLYGEILAELNILSTQSSLIGIAYDAQAAGPDAEAAAQAAENIAAQSDRLFDRVYSALALLADTPYWDIIDAEAGEGAAEALRDYEPLTEEEAALFQEETRLTLEYDQIMARPGLSEEERARQAGELYRRLVQLRTRIAVMNGYENYAEYSYEVEYSRDYSVQRAQSLQKAVKAYIVPLSEKVLDHVGSRELRELSRRGRADGEQILDGIQPFIRRLDPELGRTFDFMRDHHLYDIEASDSKLPTGYTIGLPAYGSAFIFNSPYGTCQDYSDTVHEFGHFNETFHSATHELWAGFNIDVGEIHSQTLELLFTSCADQVFGEEYGGTYTTVILSNILNSVLEGCMYDEFQTAVYQDPDMSLEDINRLFKQVSEQYGYVYAEEQEESDSWVEVSHNFQSPLYYISYATSALSSLDLWLRAQEDWDEAVDLYMDLTALSLDVPYRAAIRYVGLTDIFRRGAVKELAERLEAHLDRPESHSFLLFIATAAVLAVFVLLLWALIMLVSTVVLRVIISRHCQRVLEDCRAAARGNDAPHGPGG